MPWRDSVNAIVQAWYPGQAGGQAIAEIVAGRVNPSGRLPITFPVDLGRPRHQEMFASRDFIELQRAIIRTIREESMKAELA